MEPEAQPKLATKPVGTSEQMVANCFFCQEATIAAAIGQTEMNDPEMGWSPRTIISLVRCTKCTDAMLFKQEEATTPDPDGSWRFWRSPERLWPWEEGWLSDEIPEPLRNEHKQARACFRAFAYTATVVMVRRTLEGVCIDHGLTKGTLANKIQELSKKGHIDGQLVEWASELRVIGNEGAHYTGNAVSHEDAADALALAEALLDYVYVFSRRFKQFKQRRTTRTPPENH